MNWQTKRPDCLIFAPQCSHRLQPLDVSFMIPVFYWHSWEVLAKPRKRNNRIPILQTLSRSLKSSSLIVCCIQSGMEPINRYLFKDQVCLFADTTDVILGNKRASPKNLIVCIISTRFFSGNTIKFTTKVISVTYNIICSNV